MCGEKPDRRAVSEHLGHWTWRVSIMCCSNARPSLSSVSPKQGPRGAQQSAALAKCWFCLYVNPVLYLATFVCTAVTSLAYSNNLSSPYTVLAHFLGWVVGLRGWKLRGRITAAPAESSCTLPKLFVCDLDKHLGKIQPPYLCASHSQSAGTYLSETYHVPDGRIKWLSKHTVT